MTLEEVARKLGLEVLVGADLGLEVRGGYVGDLLSRALADSEEGSLWITHQRHLNVVAVAKLKGLAGVVYAQGVRPYEEALERAREEGVNLLSSGRSAFETAGLLFRILREKSD
ncbi:TPA: serine kinase [Candidatus Micrarchaeota archaeon]|nr:serine kinase [Candidatus Micrarchaeota archaeon]